MLTLQEYGKIYWREMFVFETIKNVMLCHAIEWQ